MDNLQKAKNYLYFAMDKIDNEINIIIYNILNKKKLEKQLIKLMKLLVSQKILNQKKKKKKKKKTKEMLKEIANQFHRLEECGKIEQENKFMKSIKQLNKKMIL